MKYSTRLPARATPAQIIAARTQRSATGCWEWTGARSKGGYGQLGVAGKTVYAHRWSYVAHGGRIADGMFVCHRCDNPSCVNPAHLFLGTALHNAQDKVDKGRQPRGSQHGMARLSEVDVLLMRTMRAAGASLADLGSAYGVSRSGAQRACSGTDWGHVCR